MNSTKILAVLFLAMLSGCKGDQETPAPENPSEVIDEVQLLFAPQDGAPVVVTATDPDGDGPADISPNQVIELAPNTEYSLFITFENSISGEDITEEVEKEADEHMIFFEFGESLFDSPEGNGNIDNRSDQINYQDTDGEGLPLGLVTGWITPAGGSGDFRVVLKHQPDTKSASSTADDGSTDVDITWSITIQ